MDITFYIEQLKIKCLPVWTLLLLLWPNLFVFEIVSVGPLALAVRSGRRNSCIMETWQFNAPRGVDFMSPAADADDCDDCFFDTPTGFPLHEANSKYVIKELNKVIKTEVESPVSENGYQEKRYEYCEAEIKEEPLSPPQRGHRRRSMSVNAIMQTTAQNEYSHKYNKQEYEHNLNYMNALNKNKKTFSQSKLLGKSVSTCSLQSHTKTGSGYIPTAEAIYYLQKDTPERFHTRSRNEIHKILEAANRFRRPPLQSTIPHSPALLSKNRTRPVNALSQKEIEDLEIEEIKKHKFKAHPVSKTVILGISNLAPVQRRPTTQLKPFNLTEKKNHINIVYEEKKDFKARPVPKHVLEKPFEIAKKIVPITVPMSPNITRPKCKSLEHVSKQPQPEIPKQKTIKFSSKSNVNLDRMKDLNIAQHTGVPPVTKPAIQQCKPFSFEQRDKERELMKQEKIQKFLKEEKEKREFHANPIPKCILKKMGSSDTTSHSSESRKENKENHNDNKDFVFKARSPAILHKEPFVPLKPGRRLLEPCNIELTTDKRARERDLFNKKLKEKEEMREAMQKLKEKERMEEEERQIAILRSQLVHKAGPVKHYPPVIVHPSDVPLTNPKSPNFARINDWWGLRRLLLIHD